MSKKENTYVFRYPCLKMRVEKFGGLAQSEKGIFMLGHIEFNTLSKFQGYMLKDQAERELGIDLLETFSNVGFLLEINQKVAETILMERR